MSKDSVLLSESTARDSQAPGEAAAAGAADKLRQEGLYPAATTVSHIKADQSPAVQHLTMTDAFAESHQTNDNRGGEARGNNGGISVADSGKERQRWTVAIDLSSSDEDQGVKEGGQRQSAEIQKLVEQSKGTDVTFMVQTTNVDKESAPGPDGLPSGTLERYAIHDGKIQSFAPEQSHGLADDTRSLLQWAGKQAPSDKIALISQGHGHGVDGIAGDSGMASLPALSQAIKDGLVGSGHDKLDVLDFDRCLMGSAGVQSRLYKVADHIVSSEEDEHCNGAAFDGQTLSAPLADLLKHPQMSAGQFADSFVRSADAGANGSSQIAETNGPNPHSGVDTLAHFDSAKMPQFTDKLGQFGTELARALDDPKSRAQIEKIIGSTQSFPEGQKIKGDGERDLKSFVEKVLDSARSGLIDDQDHKIASAAQKLLDAQRQMTPSYHGENSSTGYEKLGGLSVFLPDGTVGDRAHSLTDLARLAEGLDGARAEKVFADRSRWSSDIDRMLGAAREHASPAVLADLDRLKAAQSLVVQAHTHDQALAALKNFTETARKLNGGALDQDETAALVPQSAMRRKILMERSQIGDADGWNRFVQKLAV